MTDSVTFDRAPQGVSPAQPHSARIYDYLLGGKDNYEADRAVAQRLLSIAPDTRTLAWFSRQFLLYATRVAAEAGIRQFLDLGSGFPTEPHLHEIARTICPDARVVAVDYDPVVVAHTAALLEHQVTALLMDARDPEALIDEVRSTKVIDFDQPVAVLMVGLLHYITDDENPGDIIARFRKHMAPGSYLALTHVTTDDTDPRIIHQTTTDTRGSPAQVQYRSTAAVRDLLEGFDILGPGIAPVQQWLGGDIPATRLTLLGAVCRTRQPLTS
ncbi:SAM-dependent methyltransferase [Nocardia sp. NPDC004068]|uniref:SAM-dependent methyltransferase n=1 Tax=Nocardia sp. NPDC004068 TaxID=3364303 RepID=UPI003695DE97